jgi:adenosylmethionine-8-amino-7-oxononanoate aminotransferase
MKAVCEKYGALFILDEIMSGMGRCGTLHAWEQEDVVPDIQTIGKGLGGGYAPVSGILIGDSIVQTMDKGSGMFRHGQTYQGHPISCAAALAVQKTIKQDNLLENVRQMGAYLEQQLRQRFESHPYVGDIRGKGLFWGVSCHIRFSLSRMLLDLSLTFLKLEFVKDKVTKEPFDPSVRLSFLIQEKGLQPEYSVSLYGCPGTVDGIKGDHLILAPAYIVSKAEIDIIVDTLEKVLEEVFATLQK